ISSCRMKASVSRRKSGATARFSSSSVNAMLLLVIVGFLRLVIVSQLQLYRRPTVASPTCLIYTTSWDITEFEDIDALNKPFHIPSNEELQKAKEKFEKDHVTLTAIPLTTGKQLAKLAESCTMDLSEPAFDLS